MKRTRCVELLVAVILCLVTASLPAAEPSLSIGDQVADFRLPNHRGGERSLSEFSASKLVVLAFLGTECPLAKLYGPRLAELQDEYSKQGVAFIGINANTQDSPTEITAYANRYELSFPLLKDVGNRVADQIGATRTPQVVVLDHERKVRYHGRIDDQYGIGYARERAERRDLAIALDELLAGKPVSQPTTEAFGCRIGRVNKIKPHGEVTYTNQIARILNKRCVECHREGELAPFTLTSYQDVLGWEETILEVIDDNRMPPWFADPQHGKFSNDARLSDQEKSLLRRWIENGMPEGDVAQLPEPRKFTKGWRIPKPQQVLHMRDQAFDVPAEGIVNYQYFWVDPKWTEDKYIDAAEARPDNRSVVHHIIVYAVQGGEDERRRGRGRRRMLVGYAPGSTPNVLNDGVAMHVPAGSKLLFEMHYTPNGRKQSDRSYVGFHFVDQKDVKKQLRGRAVVNNRFRIPPREEHHPVQADYSTGRDELLLSMTPHMHLRGKSFRYEAFYPDGEREILLDVPRYDFNWQLSYKLAEPKLLPKGTRIVCTAHFDNSENNVVNPNPDKEVRWGDQSFEEMMIGFFNVVAPDTEAVSLKSQAKIDPTGLWTWERNGEQQSLQLQLKGDKLSGTIKALGRETSITNAVVQGDQLRFQVALPELGDLLLNFSAKVGEDEIRGEVTFTVESVGKARKLAWTASRKK